MIRILSLVFILFTFADADYLYIKTNECVYAVTPYQDETGWCYTKRANDRAYCNKSAKIEHFINGYSYDEASDTCSLSENLTVSGLKESSWNYQLALLANFVGFSMFFLINYMSVIVAKGGN